MAFFALGRSAGVAVRLRPLALVMLFALFAAPSLASICESYTTKDDCVGTITESGSCDWQKGACVTELGDLPSGLVAITAVPNSPSTSVVSDSTSASQTPVPETAPEDIPPETTITNASTEVPAPDSPPSAGGGDAACAPAPTEEDGYVDDFEDDEEELSEEQLAATFCSEPFVSGPCMAFFERWGYDAAAGRCVSFVYGGCWANENNFETLEECSAAAAVYCDAAPAPAPSAAV